ncbi:hypothetical protein QQF64_035658 [Cirrhinus molitorella]|uniref:Reverse transcriptase n=1 Tax=Cirrhinus molitorella TaxID=172907 RepID=A0ABR3NGF8_9TELE
MMLRDSKDERVCQAGIVVQTGRKWSADRALKEAEYRGRSARQRRILALTSLRPDIVLWSRGTKQVVLIELTVPWEERMEEAYERKLKKYQGLILESQQNGWKAWNLPVEVGCRGFAGQSLWRTLGLLGIEGMARKRLVGKVTEQAESASHWIWIQREVRWQSQSGEGQITT